MKRTTSLLTTGALGLGTIAVLSGVAPGVASASGCGPTAVDQNTLGSTFASGWGEQRGKHTAVMEDEGLHLTTAGRNATAAWFYDLDEGLPLADMTAQSNTGIDLTVPSGDLTRAATYELVVDIDGPDGLEGLTWLVYEQRYQERRPDTWWSSLALDAIPDRKGHGSPDFGTLAEISAAYPDATVQAFGFAAGPGQKDADVVVHGVTFGCNEFRFAHADQAPTAAVEVTHSGHETFAFSGTGSADVDGEVVSYSWDFGDGSEPADGVEVEHSFPALGSYTVTLTVTDDAGNTGTATSDVLVESMAPTVFDSPLPNTGADVLPLVAVGGLALAAGGLGLALSRRRPGSRA